MQVREHTESTARQYGLAEMAARLGWPAGGIEVIDADLGLSGRSASHREGFKQLVARVCLGEVGAVFGLEVSRLARSSADLARLLELARLTATLVVDPDGSVRSSVTELPRDQREVLIPDHHQGYITWEAYLANQDKLAANRTNAGARPPREGTALCQGIVFCGACGRSMQVRYQDRYPR